MRLSILLLLAVPLALPAQTSEPSFRSTTSEVLLDLVARDKHGKIIHDLRPEEVHVFEDGVPQPVHHFEFIDGRSDPAASLIEREPPSPAAPLSVAPSTEPLSVTALRDISLVSVVIANLDPRGRKLAVDSMRSFIEHDLRPRTYVGVFALGFGTLRVVQPYTNDAEKISAAMGRAARAAMVGQLTSGTQLSIPDTDFGSALNEDAGTAADPNGPGGPTSAATSGLGGPAALLAQVMDTSWVNEMHDVYAESTNYLTPLREFVQAQSEIPGRKVMLLFSAGLPVQLDTVDLLHSVISAANRSNVSIYAVDTRGVTTQSHLDDARRILQAAAQASMRQQLDQVTGGDQSVTPVDVLSMEMLGEAIHSDTNGNMAELAQGTGGALLPDSLNLLDPLRRAMEDVRTHYELGYSPTHTAMDGAFRKISVKVSRPGVRVFARSGYFAVPLLNGGEVYPFELATLKALDANPAPHQFNFRASALQFRAAPDRQQFAYAFQATTRKLTITTDGPWAKVHVSVTALIRNDQGQIVEKISKDIPYEVPKWKKADLQHGIVSFSAPFGLAPGHYMLETAAVDRNGLKQSVIRAPLVVTDNSGFSMSEVIAARRVDRLSGPLNRSDPLESRGGKITPDLSETTVPDQQGDLKLYAVAYPSQPVDAPLRASVEIWRSGQLAMQSPGTDVPMDANGGASMLAIISTRKFRAGHYVAQVLFEYKGQTVSKSVPFTVAAGN